MEEVILPIATIYYDEATFSRLFANEKYEQKEVKSQTFLSGSHQKLTPE